MPLGLQDALLNNTVTLPAGASASASGAAIDLGLLTKHGEVELTRAEFEIDAPALTTVQLPNGDTITYDVIISANANLSSPVTVYKTVLTQTGAGGAGAGASSARFRLPNNLNTLLAQARYVGVTVNTGAGVAAGAGVTATLAVDF